MSNLERLPALQENWRPTFRRPTLTPDGRAALLKFTLPVACAAGLLLSPKLWLTSRDYPLSPVAGWLPAATPPFDLFTFIAALALLALGAAAPRPVKHFTAFLLIAVLLALLDQSRWQPWFYQYVFMLAAFCFSFRGGHGAEERDEWLNTCRLIVVTIYFWSGLQKLNVGFVDQIFPILVDPYLKYAFGATGLVPRAAIVLIPLLEVCVAIGLLTRKLRGPAVALAVATHVTILLLFIPLRRNSVVWPWNAAMACFVVILFWRAREFSWREVLLPKTVGFRLAVAVLFGVIPLFNLFDAWDSYLSATLYSGNITEAVIYVNEAAERRLPPGVRRHVTRSRPGARLLISPTRWASSELNVPAYPERRVFIDIARRVCEYAESPADVSLVIYGRPSRLRGARQTATHTCAELRAGEQGQAPSKDVSTALGLN